MASFVAATTLTAAQTLINNETGIVTGTGKVIVATGAAVTMAGDTTLTVFGDVLAQTDSAVRLDAIADGLLTVAQGGGLTSAAGGAALSGTVSGQFTLKNGGQMIGAVGAALTVMNSDAALVIANAGRISGNSTTAAVALTFLSAATVTVNNSGVMESLGNAQAFAFDLGTIRLNNSGQILAAVSGLAVDGLGSVRMVNSGQITGDIAVLGASVINNSGTILGDITLGDATDRVSVKGTVDGSIALGHGDNVFEVLGGLITGTVHGGAGSDSYTVDQAGLQIVDDGGTLDTLKSYVDVVVPYGIEVTTLAGAVGLAAIGSRLGETVFGAAGNDSISGEGGDDTLFGGMGDDVVSGGRGGDFLSGDAGNDLVRGGDGNDVMALFSGADTVKGGTGTDLITLEALTSAVPVVINLATGTGQIGAGTTISLISIENVMGSQFADTVTGNRAANMLNGGAGDDTLAGAAGADTLMGGIGADVLDGGAGPDTFVFADMSWSASSAGIDRIIGFSKRADVIDLSLIDAIAGGNDSDFAYIGTQAFSGTGPQVRFVEHGRTTVVQVRLDGSLLVDMVIRLDNDLALTMDNFIL